jgi:hypothetical protein
MTACTTRGCSNSTNDRHRFCSSCRRRRDLRAAEAKGRWEAVRPEAEDALRPILRDIQVLAHPDAHAGAPKRHALAEEVSKQLRELQG